MRLNGGSLIIFPSSDVTSAGDEVTVAGGGGRAGGGGWKVWRVLSDFMHA